MPGAFAPRFAIEAAFLILLGAGAGYADLRPAVIVALLAGGWLLVSLIELAIWRSQARPAVDSVPAPVPADEPESAEGVAPVVDEAEYPLRPNAGDQRSEEVEAYTRILGGAAEDDPSGP